MKNAILMAFLASFILFPLTIAQPCNTGADTNCDNMVSISELTDYIDAWYACSSCAPDVLSAITAYYESTCVPECAGKQCGDDGCGGECPPGCGSGESCIGGLCEIIDCLPSNNCYLVSPAGAGTHNGSAGNEFTLAEAQSHAELNPDTSLLFLLEGGDYGQFYYSNPSGSRTENAVFRGLDSLDMPRITNLYIRNSPNALLKFENIDFGTTFELGENNAVQIYGSESYQTSGIEIRNSHISSEPYENGTRSGKGIDILTAKDILISNCEVENSSYGIRILTGNNITIKDSDIHDCHADALRIDDTNDSLFENNTIHDVRVTEQSGTTHRDAIQIIAWNPLSTNNLVFRDNMVFDTESQGIHAYSGGGYLGSLVLVGNIFYGRFADKDHGNTYTVFQFEGVNGLTMINNTFVPDFGAASGIWSGCDDAEIKNNLFVGSMYTDTAFKVSNDMTSGYQDSNIFSEDFMSDWNINDFHSVGDGLASSISLGYDAKDIFVDNGSENMIPLMDSPACDGTVNQPGVAVGALPCICISDLQCVQVFGAGSTCDSESGGCIS